MNRTIPQPCGCKDCRSPEAEAAYAEALKVLEADRVINERAFALLLEDRDAGRPTKTNAAYRAAAEAEASA